MNTYEEVEAWIKTNCRSEEVVSLTNGWQWGDGAVTLQRLTTCWVLEFTGADSVQVRAGNILHYLNKYDKFVDMLYGYVPGEA